MIMFNEFFDLVKYNNYSVSSIYSCIHTTTKLFLYSLYYYTIWHKPTNSQSPNDNNLKRHFQCFLEWLYNSPHIPMTTNSSKSELYKTVYFIVLMCRGCHLKCGSCDRWNYFFFWNKVPLRLYCYI
ncbi:hypothetical protein PPL_06076 [Heterostelium album PN500]|uniref:Uncharacterized protein n=1 Tax=Heterostelium pallidum (strain ATCC 26659 / Pp 5 / PN500) TaxID=670386 RepID=D3BC54_HETP5|nr:hypothetical protein PPL_06076 [Heterostelium album PN500]EFA81237.1 hypothetical protein PPL_06076 [Heterostelium album PN500]|eukprot:XP_020433355.1 hypothetical protein PPL_06076 [Heterostelium album PN500]